MRKLVVFNPVSLDGYFVDANGSMSWAKGGRVTKDPEWDAFVTANAGGGNTKDEERTRRGHCDFGKRHHCFAIDGGGAD